MSRLWIALGWWAVVATPVAAQRTHVLVVTGLGGEPAYTKSFTQIGAGLFDVARTQWGVADSSLVWLAEDPTLDPTRIRGRATREEVEAAFVSLSRRASPGDVVFVVLIGHGSGEGAASRVNLPGPDPSAAEYATWVGGLSQQSVVFVNAASASGDFVRVLAGPGRVVMTATRTALERNETTFATHLLRGLATGEADADKDTKISALEAFDYARREVVRTYESERKLLTERAQLSDTALAATVVFGAVRGDADPRIVALVAERRALENDVAALRARKDSMAAAAYDAELERLLLAIAEKTRAIRALGGGQ